MILGSCGKRKKGRDGKKIVRGDNGPELGIGTKGERGRHTVKKNNGPKKRCQGKNLSGGRGGKVRGRSLCGP